MSIANDLPLNTTADVIDMIAKVLLIRSDRSETTVTWDELERASTMKCEIVKTSEGVILRRVRAMSASQ